MKTATVLLLASAACASPAAAPPPVIAPGEVAGPVAAPAMPLRVRRCKITTTTGNPGVPPTVIEVAVGEDAAGDAVDLRYVTSDASTTLSRSYDAKHRFLTERRRETGTTSRQASYTWTRDEAGRVATADRVESGDHPMHVFARVTERHTNGRWLRRELQVNGAPAMTDERGFDAEGRPVRRVVVAAPQGEKPGEVHRYTYAYAPNGKLRTESIDSSFDEGQHFTDRNVMTLDEQGRPVVVEHYISTALMTKSEATYDAAGRFASRLERDGSLHRWAYEGDCPADVKGLFDSPDSAKDSADGT